MNTSKTNDTNKENEDKIVVDRVLKNLRGRYVEKDFLSNCVIKLTEISKMVPPPLSIKIELQVLTAINDLWNLKNVEKFRSRLTAGSFVLLFGMEGYSAYVKYYELLKELDL